MNVNTYQHINLEYLELMADGDESMKKIMLEMLLEELPVELQKMRGQLDANDWEGLKSTSHKMKSTLSYVGNEEMTVANSEIEKITKDSGDHSRLPSLMATVESQFEKIMPELVQESEKL